MKNKLNYEEDSISRNDGVQASERISDADYYPNNNSFMTLQPYSRAKGKKGTGHTIDTGNSLKLPTINFKGRVSSNSALSKIGPMPDESHRTMGNKSEMSIGIKSNTKRSGIIRDTESRIRGEDELGEINSYANNESIDASDQNILDSNRADFSDGYRYRPQHNKPAPSMTTRAVSKQLKTNLHRISIDEEQNSREDDDDWDMGDVQNPQNAASERVDDMAQPQNQNQTVDTPEQPE